MNFSDIRSPTLHAGVESGITLEVIQMVLPDFLKLLDPQYREGLREDQLLASFTKIHEFLKKMTSARLLNPHEKMLCSVFLALLKNSAVVKGVSPTVLDESVLTLDRLLNGKLDAKLFEEAGRVRGSLLQVIGLRFDE
ncbi:MAG: hypothetical protein AB7J40_03980 [Candidatus Altimarinota bacterium]